MDADVRKMFFHSPREESGYRNICRFNLRSLDSWRCRLRYLTGMVLRPGIRDLSSLRAAIPVSALSLYSVVSSDPES